VPKPVPALLTLKVLGRLVVCRKNEDIPDSTLQYNAQSEVSRLPAVALASSVVRLPSLPPIGALVCEGPRRYISDRWNKRRRQSRGAREACPIAKSSRVSATCSSRLQPEGVAAACSLASHAMIIVPVTVLGLIYLSVFNISLSGPRRGENGSATATEVVSGL